LSEGAYNRKALRMFFAVPYSFLFVP